MAEGVQVREEVEDPASTLSAAPAAPPQLAEAPRQAPGVPCVLVCDGEELIRWPIAEQLTSDGYRVVGANDGVHCLEQIAAQKPDALILDVNMPKLDGFGVLRRVRELGLHVPVLVITAHKDIDTVTEAMRLGASAYLVKPFDARELTLQVARVLEVGKLERELRELRSFRERVTAERTAFAADNADSGELGPCPFELPDGGVDLEGVERGLLAQALRRCRGNQSAAARMLKISRFALRYRMQKFKLH